MAQPAGHRVEEEARLHAERLTAEPAIDGSGRAEAATAVPELGSARGRDSRD